jgi:hypothetical protein
VWWRWTPCVVNTLTGECALPSPDDVGAVQKPPGYEAMLEKEKEEAVKRQRLENADRGVVGDDEGADAEGARKKGTRDMYGASSTRGGYQCSGWGGAGGTLGEVTPMHECRVDRSNGPEPRR